MSDDDQKPSLFGRAAFVYGLDRQGCHVWFWIGIVAAIFFALVWGASEWVNRPA